MKAQTAQRHPSGKICSAYQAEDPVKYIRNAGYPAFRMALPITVGGNEQDPEESDIIITDFEVALFPDTMLDEYLIFARRPPMPRSQRL